jgi:hypothetical protein
MYWHNNQGYFEPSSLAWGSKAWHDVNNNPHNFGNMTRSLNHLDHTANPACTGQPNILKGHCWIHTAVEFQLNGQWDPTNLWSSKMFVNGNPGLVGSTALTDKVPYTFSTMTTWAAGLNILDSWDKHSGGDSNQLRLGATSKIAKAAIQTGNAGGVAGAYKGNYSGDHTIDEFYAWDLPNDSNVTTLWVQGRYYKPLGSQGGTANSGEGLFTSQPITFITANPRTGAPPSNVPTPGGSSGAPSSVPVIPPQIRILGLSWTWYGDDLDPVTGLQTLYDHQGTYGTQSANVMPQVLCGIIDTNQTYGPFSNDGFSTVQAPDGTIPVIQDPKNVKYFIQFALPQATATTILLSTPVLDDITLYFDDSRTHLLAYALDNRSF